MRAASGTMLGLILLIGCLTAPMARADDAPKPTCDVPANLVATEAPLPRVEGAVKAGQPLNVLVVGSRSSTIPSSEASAYPAQLQAALKEKLPASTINLSVELMPSKTAEEAANSFARLVEARKPTLVVWQTGTVDAIRSIDPDDFRSAVDEGIVALQKAGVDVVLVNPQYSPRTDTMTSTTPYLDNLRVAAQQHDVPLFDRFAVMQHWSDSGDFDLFSAARGNDLAKKVHACLGLALSKFVIDAAHLGPSQQN